LAEKANEHSSQPLKAEQKTSPKPQTETMEVHKHPHHVMHKKNWSEYLLEFLLLFLAVFLGFVAENFREHEVEKEREKQYMQSLSSDLSKDTATINAALPLKQLRIDAVDSVFGFFNNHRDATTISGKLFRMIRRTSYDLPINRNIITLNQLKNAGGMRLVRNKQVADSIAVYDLNYESLNSLYNVIYFNNGQTSNRHVEKLINAFDMLSLYSTNTTGAIVANVPDDAVIRINPSELNEVLNFMMQEKAHARQEIEKYKVLEEETIHLMELIKKEYHLD
jgi:hypothetical protein